MTHKNLDEAKLSQELQQQVEKALVLLADLRLMITEKREQIIKKRAGIDDKIESLPEPMREMLNTGEYARAGESVAQFVELLDKMIDEIDHDVKAYQLLLHHGYSSDFLSSAKGMDEDGDDASDGLLVRGSEAMAEVLLHRITAMKRYAKVAHRDLSISYSRYSFGFDEQLKQLDYLHYLAKSMKPAN